MMMKTSLACTLSLLALGGVVPHQVMAAPAAETAAALPAPEVGLPRYYGAMTEDFTISVSFPVPMVPAEEVGKPVKPGEIVAVEKDAILVSAKEGILRILELQLEGKKRMSAHDFLLGVKMQPGEVLGC